MILPPCEVNEFRIDAAAQQLRVARFELLVQRAECGDLRGANESEILRPEKEDLPFAGVIAIGDGLKRSAFLGAYRCGQ